MMGNLHDEVLALLLEEWEIPRMPRYQRLPWKYQVGKSPASRATAWRNFHDEVTIQPNRQETILPHEDPTSDVTGAITDLTSFLAKMLKLFCYARIY